MSRTLAEWLAYQERVNVHSIELGLDRVRAVWQRMGAAAPARHVITVAGTNGKGSTVALLEAILEAAGKRVGSFVSPHLLRYNERVRVAGCEASDAALIAAFERIETARGDIPLTYFEFGTLAALDIFARVEGQPLDVVVLEVGLGGRLDAVNIVDADVAVITTIDLDHMEWLGPDRDSIGREKAGVARAGHPVIVGELDPPVGLLAALDGIGAKVQGAGVDFGVKRDAAGWSWRRCDGTVMELPDPALAGAVQWDNAATAIAALHALEGEAGGLVPMAMAAAAAAGLRAVHVPGRLQRLPGDPLLVVDVGHNPQAARVLARWVDTQGADRVHAVYGAMVDKDIAGVMAALGARVTHWYLGGLEQETSRGMDSAGLARMLRASLPEAAYDTYADIPHALAAARAAARAGDCVLAFGSFYVARAVLNTRPATAVDGLPRQV